ncbi:hypothetical protein [Xylanibacter muris]|uniref:Uncharacterized protein n=1 Tax=Xylanibacter muris TaxID=2736290 RepID=A0ABX2ANC6_9BACT|nr:hypothetical protein [Xylanibacter muris]NPD91724.1 hypothetical protein [Xylanibacter muris]
MQNTTDYNVFIKPENIPEDINAETLLCHYPEGTFNVKFCGLHKRNSYKDILNLEQIKDCMLLHLGRNSLYNSLPEYIFHSIDRFEHIPEHDKKERFAEEYAKQEKEKEKAYRYFAPIDTLLLQLRLQAREQLNKYVETNTVIQNILLDRIPEKQKGNRFVKRTIPYIVSCKTIRGNRTLITLLLRKVLSDEGISICVQKKQQEFSDAHPKYNDSEGGCLGDVYAGNSFVESAMTYTISYWSDDECDSEFLTFLDEIETYRQFIQDFFLSVDSILVFNIEKEAQPLRISDTTIYNYLNYNTNI